MSMNLKRIVGVTTNGQHSLIVQPNGGKLIYFAGCVVVIVNPKTKAQQHLISSSKQNITSHAISDDGKYLATSDCGAHANVRVWDLDKLTLEVEILGKHCAEVSCMSFSADGHTLVSIGGQQDLNMLVWHWRQQELIASHKLSTKVRSVSFSADSSYFVTVGEASIKYWFIQASSSEGLISLTSRSATLGEQKRSSFCDVRCGRGAASQSTYCITRNGLLCELNSKRLLHKWVDLRTSSANSIRVCENIIIVACSNGVTRCFNTQELRFLKNLPRPHALGKSATSEHNSTQISANSPSSSSLTYPHTINADLDEATNIVACIYNDHSIYAWDFTAGLASANLIHAALYHSSCIWGLDMYPSSALVGAQDVSSTRILPTGSFVTCSSDDTVRIWSPRVVSSSSKLASARVSSRAPAAAAAPNGDMMVSSLSQSQPVSEELHRILFTDLNNKFLCDPDSGKSNQDYDSAQGLRCLKISPDGRHLAVGGRAGTIKIFDLSPSEKPESVMLKSIAAHDAEVLCLEYSDPNRFNGFYYMASSSRDKLIHLFDAAADYAFLQTIDDHTSSITALRFVNNRASDSLQLVSCGADRKIVFRNGITVKQPILGKPKLEFVDDQQIEGKTTFYDMEVDSESSCLMLACQDRMVRLFSVAQGRYQSGFPGSMSDHGTLIKIALDPSCTFLATSSTDKSISIFDYQRGERIASVSEGLADLVTDLKFSRDGKYLVASTGDGCIFIWSSPSEIANTVSGHLDIAQLSSLSSCSLGSMPNATQTPQESSVKQLPRWAQDDLSGTESAGANSENAGSRLYRVVQTAASDESNIPNSILRNSRQPTNSSMEESEPAAQVSPQPSRIYRSHGDSTSYKPPSWRNQQSANNTGGLVSNMAKLFQSRENLDKISSRERFVADGLALSAKVAPIASARASLSGNHKPTSMIASERADNSSADDDDNGRGVGLDDNGNDEDDDDDDDDDEEDAEVKKIVQRQVSPMRSRSLGRRATTKGTIRYPGGSVAEPALVKRRDWHALDPNQVELNRDLCQQLVEDLQMISKFVTRLHPRLQATERRDLASLVARGVQNSMDILSIVPARSLSAQRGLSSATLAARGQSQVSLVPKRRGQSQAAGSAAARASSISRPGSATGQRSALPTATRQSRADTMTRSRTQARPQQAGGVITRTTSSGSGLNIDQVLEAYSDRLFRMVQERMAVQAASADQRAADHLR